jgi:hypothetical protein
MAVTKVDRIGAENYASRLKIYLYSGLEDRTDLTPVLMPMDDHGRPAIKRTDDNIDYYFSRIDYFDKNYHVAASRNIYIILPGQHNQAAYLPLDGRVKVFEVHRGFGHLMLSNPEEVDSDGLQTGIYELNPDVTPAITVPPDNFFVFEAADWQQDPLVVSELVKSEAIMSIRPKQVGLKPHEYVLMTENGRVNVPEDFSSYSFA